MPNETAEDLELYHFGIKGMKWGVRRKEGKDGTVGSAVAARKVSVKARKGDLIKNEDGSVTPRDGAAARRVSKSLNKAVTKDNEKRLPNSEDRARTDALKTKPIRALSNKELQDVNNRLNLEQNYSRLTEKPSTMQKGMKYANGTLAVVGVATAAYKLKDNPLVTAVRKSVFK